MNNVYGCDEEVRRNCRRCGCDEELCKCVMKKRVRPAGVVVTKKVYVCNDE